MGEGIVNKCLEDFKYSYYEIGRGESVPYGMFKQLSSELTKTIYYNWGMALIPGSVVTNMKVYRLTKEARRLGIYIEVTMRMPSRVTKKKLKYASVFDSARVGKRVLKICDSYYLTDGGSRYGFVGGTCNKKGTRDWHISGQPLPKVRDRKKLIDKRNRELVETIGDIAYKALLRGCFLQIWRNSTPHNWWIETKKGKLLWHSGEGHPRPSLSLFDKVDDSDQKVSYFGAFIRGADEGMPVHSKYKLRRA